MAKTYTVSDGTLLLTLHPLKSGRFGVTCPDDPALITEAADIKEAFAMARDAAKTLARARAKERGEFASKRKRRTA